MPEILFIHIASASLAIASGYVALFARKGAPLHRRVGLVFVYAMLLMGISASVLAIAKGRESQVGAGLLIAYFTITALTTVREPSAKSRMIDCVMAGFGLGLGLTGLALTVNALLVGVYVVDGSPVAAGLVVKSVLLLAGVGDLRVLRTGPLRGGARLYRHLWRMCYAFFIATGSFFLGQADEIPAAIRYWPALFVLAFTPLLAMAWWAWQLRPRKREREPGAMTTGRAYAPAALEAVK
jgi:hypothetical protein